MKEEIKTREAFTVVGLKYCGDNRNDEIGGLWEAFRGRVGEILGRVPGSGAYGVMGNYSEDTRGMGDFDAEACTFEYVAGVEVEPGAAVPEGMARWDIPKATYFVYTFPIKEIIASFDYVYRVWLPESEYEYAGTPEFEFYPEGFDPEDEESEMSLYVPIK